MAYDERIAERVRQAMAGRGTITERKMFGGLSFMLGGNMCCGVLGHELVVRVGAEAHADALALPHARPMDFTGRPMSGIVYVTPPGYADDAALAGWINRGVAFAGSLPPK